MRIIKKALAEIDAAKTSDEIIFLRFGTRPITTLPQVSYFSIFMDVPSLRKHRLNPPLDLTGASLTLFVTSMQCASFCNKTQANVRNDRLPVTDWHPNSHQRPFPARLNPIPHPREHTHPIQCETRGSIWPVCRYIHY